MARLASQGKLGYYPTPEDELDRIMEIVKINNINALDVLDPCFGDGRALLRMKKTYENNITTYGVELDSVRFTNAMSGDVNFGKFIDVGLQCDALQEVVVNKNSFDVLFLNPPYDVESIDEVTAAIIGRKRLESRFLEKYTDSLIPGGLLIYIVPSNSVFKDFSYLTKKYELVSLYAFESFSDFRQVVFIGKRKSIDKKDIPKKLESNILSWLKDLTNVDLYGDDDISKITSKRFGVDKVEYTPEVTEKPKIKIFTSLLDPELMIEKIQPLEDLDGFSDSTKLKTLSINPIQEPREGHLALLTASGLMDGEIEDGVYIKGTVNTEVNTIEEKTEDGKAKTISTYVPKVTLFLYNDNEKTLYEVK
jgi:hypothetical protein